MKKYELTNEIKNLPDGVVLYRIRALKDFANVKAGDLGGFIQKESNLTQDWNAWVDGNAWVSGDAQIDWNARVSDDAWVGGNAYVEGNARVGGNAHVDNNAYVDGNARVGGSALIGDKAQVGDDAYVDGNARVYGNARVCGNARVGGNATLDGAALVSGEDDYCAVKGFGRKRRTTTFFRCKDGEVRVKCGCFYGDLDEFRAKVKETHGDGKMAQEYLMIADLMELHFKKE